MGSSEKFCLRWNDFETNISNAFKELRDDKDFFDVTLACDDEQIEAHKVILSACSPFFRNVLRRHHHQHPLLYLKGVKYTDLQSVLNFMYHGEVNVAQEELNSFLAVAEDLRVKGLTQNQTKSNSSTNNTSSNILSKSVPPKHLSTPSERNHSFPPKHKIHSSPGVQDDDDIEEIVPIKLEPTSCAPQSVPSQSQVYSEGNVTQEQSVTAYQDEAVYDDYEEYQSQEQVYSEGDISMPVQGTETGTGSEPNRSALYEYIKKETANDKSVFSCILCGKSNSQKINIVNHVESVHFPNMFIYTCKFCGKTYNAKNSLYVHISTSHRMQKSAY